MSANPIPGLGTTRATAVEQELRRMILTGELAPGERLRQVELAERFAVSTTPVREALGSLARQGLVRHDPQRGAVVFMPTVADVRENYELRIVLEPMATEVAAKVIDERTLQELDVIVAKMGEDPYSASYQPLNRRFHRVLYRAAERPRWLEIIESLRDAFEAYFQLEAAIEPDRAARDAAQRQHEAILVALSRHDSRKAKSLMKKHLTEVAAHFEEAARDGSPIKRAR